MSAATTTRRIRGIDALRVIAICFVVLGHVGNSHWLQVFGSSWTMPFFLFVFGYFAKTRVPTRTFLAARMRGLAVPYVSWLLVISAVYIPLAVSGVQSGPPDGEYWRIAWGGSLTFGPYNGMWFISALFFGALYYFALSRLPVLVQVAVAICALTLATISPGLLLAMPLGTGHAAAFLPFFLAGKLLRPVPLEARWARAAAPVLLLLVFAGLLAGFVTPMVLKRLELGTPGIAFLASVATCWSLMVVFTWVDSRGVFRRVPVEQYAPLFVVIALTHTAIIFALRPLDANPVVVFSLTLALSWALALLARRSPFSALLTGLPRSGRKSAPRG